MYVHTEFKFYEFINTKRQWLFVFIGFYQNNHSDLVFTKILFLLSFFLLLLFIVSIPACFSKKLSFTCIFGSVASDLSGAAKFLYTASILNTDLIVWQPQRLNRQLFLSIFKILGLKNLGLKSRMLHCRLICLGVLSFGCRPS